MSAETLDDYLAPLGQPSWADQVAADSRADDDRYTIDDDGAADWALRKIAKAERTIAEKEQMRDERIELARRWCEDATASHRSDVEFFTGLLQDYAIARREADKDCKTIDLPSGRVSTTKSKAKVVLGDKAKLVEWARKHLPDLVETETVYKVGTNDVKKRVRLVGDRVVLPSDDGDYVTVDGLKPKPETITATVDTS